MQVSGTADETTAETPQGDLTVRTIAMPADTNANGDIFGGWVLSQMDQAGGIAGVERARLAAELERTAPAQTPTATDPLEESIAA